MGCSCCCDIINGYIIIEKNIGKCSNGEIHKVCRLKDQKIFAMKKMKFKEQKDNIRIKNEIEILESFDRYNIVEYIESFPEEGFFYIIMEFCETDLSKFIDIDNRKKMVN